MEKSEEYFQKGMSLYKKGDYRAAQKAFLSCLNLDPLHSKAIFYEQQSRDLLQKTNEVESKSDVAQKCFNEQKYQEAMLHWLQVLELEPGNAIAQNFLNQAKEAYTHAKSQGMLSEDSKEEEYFKQGLKAFREKDFHQASMYWEVVSFINPQNTQARQGLNKARTAVIKEKESQNEQKQVKINTLLQEGLDFYGSGDVLPAMEKWKAILSLDLDNKDALDYIVVAKADLSESDLKSLKPTDVGISEDIAPVTSETVRLDKESLNLDSDDDGLLVMDEPDSISLDFDEQATDKTSLPDSLELEQEDSLQLEEESLDDGLAFDEPFPDTGEDALTLEEESPMDLPMMEEQDDSLSLDDEFENSTELETENSEEMIDDLQDDSLDDSLILEEENAAEPIEESDAENFVSAAEFMEEKLDEIPLQAEDEVADLDDELIDDEFELDDEFVDEDEDELIAAGYEAGGVDTVDPGTMDAVVTKYFERGLTLFKARKYEEAIIEWKKILDVDKSNQQAKEYIEKAITLYEASPFIDEHLAKGGELFEEGKYEEAIKEYEKILEIDPEMDEAIEAIDQAKLKLAEVVIPARKSKVSTAQIQDAGELAEEIIPPTKAAPAWLSKQVIIISAGVLVVIMLLSGYLYYIRPMRIEKQRQAEIQRRKEEAQKIKREIQGFFSEADMNMKLGKFSKAIDAYNRVILLDAKNDRALKGKAEAERKRDISKLLAKGDTLLKDRQYDAAINTYNQALKIDPTNSVIVSKLDDAKKGKMIYLEQKARVDEILAKGHRVFEAGDYQGAISVYRRALKILPNDVDTKNAIKEVEFEKRKDKNIAAYLKLGLARFESRKYEEAKEYFKKILKLDPHHKDAQFYLAKIEEEEKMF